MVQSSSDSEEYLGVRISSETRSLISEVAIEYGMRLRAESVYVAFLDDESEVECSHVTEAIHRLNRRSGSYRQEVNWEVFVLAWAVVAGVVANWLTTFTVAGKWFGVAVLIGLLVLLMSALWEMADRTFDDDEHQK
ncbi:MAG: hypothetical protein IT334_01085 [Thermomicrobiales bacterium]|nr:hypothetical protein [Thermomicrobiales bacterium]